MLLWRRACQLRSVPDCSGRRAACHQRRSGPRLSRFPDGISPLWSEKRSLCFAFRVAPYRRLDVALADRPLRFPVRYGATPQRVAGVSSTDDGPVARRTIRPASSASLRRIGFAHLCRERLAGMIAARTALPFQVRFPGTDADMAKKRSTMGQSMEPGADRPTPHRRLSG
jgi:hypothetical protein